MQERSLHFQSGKKAGKSPTEDTETTVQRKPEKVQLSKDFAWEQQQFPWDTQCGSNEKVWGSNLTWKKDYQTTRKDGRQVEDKEHVTVWNKKCMRKKPQILQNVWDNAKTVSDVIQQITDLCMNLHTIIKW